jgi:parallel beta-helix repeat protein
MSNPVRRRSRPSTTKSDSAWHRSRVEARLMKRIRTSLVVSLLSAASHGCGSTATPTAPRPAATVTAITISGTVALSNAGQQAQLQATASYSNGTAQSVTSVVTWQSATPTVATVSGAGLLTAVAAGTSTITASFSGTTGTTTATVTITLGGGSITACQTLSKPGAYTLAADVTDAASPDACLSIIGSNISVDCGGHSITVPTRDDAILINGAQTVSVNNCTLTGGGGYSPVVDVNQSSNVTITNSRLTASVAQAIGLNLYGVSGFTLSGSTITVNDTGTQNTEAIGVGQTQGAQILKNQITANVPGYYQTTSSSVTITGNTFTFSGSGTSEGDVVVDSGNHNTITGNAINGGWNGIGGSAWSTQGADDGIILSAEDSDLVQGNTITSVYDAGIETVAQFSNSTLDGNTITMAGYAGIGSYYGTSWTGNTVSGNRVTSSAFLAYFDYVGNLAGWPQVSSIAFQNNTFTNNTYAGQTNLPANFNGTPYPFSIVVDFSPPLALPFTGGSNVFSGNTLVTGFLIRPANLATYNGNTCSAETCIAGVGRTTFGATAGAPRRPPLRRPALARPLVVRTIRR